MIRTSRDHLISSSSPSHPTSNFVFSASSSIDHCSFASDVHDHDSFVSQLTQDNLVYCPDEFKEADYAVPCNDLPMIDQHALFQLENVVKNIKESYENYQFFKIFQGILTTLSQSNGGYKYDYATVPFLAEAFKLLVVVRIGFGIWMSSHNDGRRKSLTLPVLGLGAIFVMFIVTNNGSGHNVAGLR
ncbi:hypothetical protein LOK49_LG04G03423 [Camellia lanceoleosa]|uniref:Uncharacterized protein n=1 Tax=Camellia lanceoleosa TaxID=1840588 RepID=A0ACC0HY27_9ERIC|nr:hypothetical protein LOK49_LG04G03423 [Camellia lanceoleosa]